MGRRWGWWGGVMFAATTLAGCSSPEKSITGPTVEAAMVLPIKEAGAGQNDVVADSNKAPQDMVLPIKCD